MGESGRLAVGRGAWRRGPWLSIGRGAERRAPAPLAVGRGSWSGLKFFRGLECGGVFPWFGMTGSAAVARIGFWNRGFSMHGVAWRLACQGMVFSGRAQWGELPGC